MQSLRGPLALAFSGGLDTSYCVPRLAEDGWAVHTVYVDTGGSTPAERAAIRRQAMAVGAVAHHEVDARDQVYDRFVRFLIQGNVLRGEVYPLSVSAERTQQALSVVETARAIGARAVAHGSTGAGNDQVRFDVALRVLAPDLEIVTPIRDLGITRDQAIAYLERRGLPVPAKAGCLLDQPRSLGHHLGRRLDPRHLGRPAGRAARPAGRRARAARDRARLGRGSAGRARRRAGSPGPRSSPGWASSAEAYGIGRNIHVGETALGIKGRIGFEAGAALLLIGAHRELEKLVLTKWQTFWKDQLGRFYGDRLHEGQYFDPSLRDIEALITSSQARVTGETRVRLAPGRFQVVGTRSPHSMMDTSVATYGEENRLWTGDEARAFARVSAVPSLLAARAAAGNESS